MSEVDETLGGDDGEVPEAYWPPGEAVASSPPSAADRLTLTTSLLTAGAEVRDIPGLLRIASERGAEAAFEAATARAFMKGRSVEGGVSGTP